jgi:radical SAM protein with 4Fe4S-binding SPASM domain
MAANRREIEHMRAYWQSRGIGFYLNPLNNRAGNLASEQFVQLLPFSEAANRTQLHEVNMSGCPSLYSFIGIHWNGDVIGCCNDWRRTQVLGNATQESLRAIWQGERYQRIRQMSDTGRLNEVSLCRECGENKFSIHLGALRNLLERQESLDPAERSRDLELVAMLESFREREPELLQLGLLYA